MYITRFYYTCSTPSEVVYSLDLLFFFFFLGASSAILSSAAGSTKQSKPLQCVHTTWQLFTQHGSCLQTHRNVLAAEQHFYHTTNFTISSDIECIFYSEYKRNSWATK